MVGPLIQTRLVVQALYVTGEPLSNAAVAVSRDGAVLKRANTDAAGRVVIEGLSAGTVHLQVDLEGFVRASIPDVHLVQPCTTAIAVPLDFGILGDP